MNKIPTIFRREEPYAKYVTEEPNPVCAWVFAGEGEATRKYDGTCVMYDGSGWYARREVNRRAGKLEPANFVEVSYDSTTGKSVGWEPIEQSPFVKMHVEIMTREGTGMWPVGTYELVGPKVNGNPERQSEHVLLAHDAAEVLECPDRSFDGIRAAVLAAALSGVEGIVFHRDPGNPNTEMAKIKARDFRAEV